MKRIAVFAHYDKDATLSENTLYLLSQLVKVCERVIMVSTNLLPEEVSLLPEKVECHIRENIGYDFYSYKVGISMIDNIYVYDELLMLNDSFFISSKFDINKILNQVENEIYDICGLIDSYQFNYHIQSFFVVFKKTALISIWFERFWNNVTIMNTKKDIIFNYEIGMTQTALSHSLMVGACFRWKNRTYFDAFRNCVKTGNLGLAFLSLFGSKYLRSGNASHMLWRHIYDEFAICKWEVIRHYPAIMHYIDKTGNERDRVVANNYLKEKAGFYKEKKFDENLTENIKGSFENKYSVENIKERVISGNKIAVVLHLFYTELFDEILQYLNNIPYKFDLFISVVDFSAIESLEEKTKKFTNISTYIYRVKNRGRDVGPFISLLNTNILSRYDNICKIHSKKSLYSKEGMNWRQEIYTDLLGSTEIVLKILKEFELNPKLGLIGPENCYLTDKQFWGANELKVSELVEKVGVQKENVTLGFFAGTMFWISGHFINCLNELSLNINDFDYENGLQDGTLAHAVERIFVILARHYEFSVHTTQFLGTDVSTRNHEDRRIAVLT